MLSACRSAEAWSPEGVPTWGTAEQKSADLGLSWVSRRLSQGVMRLEAR